MLLDSEHSKEAYCDEMCDLLVEWAPERMPDPPMTGDELRCFEQTPMPFGKHQGTAIKDVPLEYLDWLIGQDDFKDKVRRYLMNPTIKEQLRGDDSGD